MGRQARYSEVNSYSQPGNEAGGGVIPLTTATGAMKYLTMHRTGNVPNVCEQSHKTLVKDVKEPLNKSKSPGKEKI